MKCRLHKNSHSDKNFQIEFDSIDELENLRNSLTQMLKYVKICQDDGEEIPPLVYKITELNTHNKKKK
jgi:hypothetical protein